nr:hypothetical protein [Tanacetum cinerariifolium]
MSTQQDIYAAGFENRSHMLNKDNYVPWCSHLLCYAKSKLNGKLIYNSIIKGPYVIRMIPELGDPDCEVLVAETFHEQTDEQLTKKEVKQMEADDQVIQIILMGLPEHIYAAVDSCKTAQEIWHMKMVGGNGGNQFRQYTGQNVGNLNGYNAVQNVKNLVVQNAVQNLGVQNVGNQNGLIVVQRIANPNANQIGNGNAVAARAEARPRKRDAAYLQTQLQIVQKEEAWIQLQAEEFNFMDSVGDLDEIEEFNANCILTDSLQQASTSGTQIDNAPIYDSDGSTKVVESNDLSNPATSNSAPSSRESIVVNNKRVIAPGIFKINPFKASGVDNFVPNKHVKASVRTKLIIASQPHVINKKDVNYITNGFSLKNAESTTRTRRPQPRNNPKNDKYVNGMKSKKKNQSANVSKSENQKKHKENIKKLKKLGSKERLASPRPSKPRTCLK